VTLKSVVSYHVNGSKSVPFAAVGMSVSDTPLRFEFDGVSLLFVVPPEDVDLCLLLTTIATGIIIISSKINIPAKITIQISLKIMQPQE